MFLLTQAPEHSYIKTLAHKQRIKENLISALLHAQAFQYHLKRVTQVSY